MAAFLFAFGFMSGIGLICGIDTLTLNMPKKRLSIFRINTIRLLPSKSLSLLSMQHYRKTSHSTYDLRYYLVWNKVSKEGTLAWLHLQMWTL